MAMRDVLIRPWSNDGKAVPRHHDLPWAEAKDEQDEQENEHEQHVSKNRGKSAGEEALERSGRRRMLWSPASRLTRGAGKPTPHVQVRTIKNLGSLGLATSEDYSILACPGAVYEGAGLPDLHVVLFRADPSDVRRHA